jgi:nicotinamide riboside kinase
MTPTPKIIVNGAESSGKTTLCQVWAETMDFLYISDMSRLYLSTSTDGYAYDDLHTIGLLYDYECKRSSDQAMICDTDWLNIIIWGLDKFGRYESQWMDRWLFEANHCTHILLQPDIPWETDPLRENPHDRDRIHLIYLDFYKQYDVPFYLLAGSISDRVDALMKIMSNGHV